MAAERQDHSEARAAAAVARLSLLEVRGPDDDDLAPSVGAVVAEPLPSLIWIRYINADGEESRRAITLREVWREGGHLQIRGWCHQRRALRTFRADRIQELVCLATGECPDDVQDWFAVHGLLAGSEGGDYTPHAIRRCRDELTILAYVAQADGFLDALEVDIAVDFVMMSTEREVDRAMIAKLVRHLAPDAETVMDCVRRLARNRRAAWPALTRAVRRLVDADGVLDPGEASAWTQIQAAFEA